MIGPLLKALGREGKGPNSLAHSGLRQVSLHGMVDGKKRRKRFVRPLTFSGILGSLFYVLLPGQRKEAIMILMAQDSTFVRPKCQLVVMGLPIQKALCFLKDFKGFIIPINFSIPQLSS